MMRMKNCFESFFEVFDGVGHSISELRRIVITHGHVDHYGFARTLVELSGARVFIRKDDIRKVTGVHAKDFTENFYEMKDFLLGMGMPEEEIENTREGVKKFAAFGKQLSDCEPFDNGNTFALGSGGQLKVIHCPGNTPGSVCLYDEGNRILFTGDHFLQDRVPNTIIEPIFGRARKYKSMVSYLSSVERMKRLSVDLVYPGHGNPFYDISSAINNVLS